jgi:hypothetical protein
MAQKKTKTSYEYSSSDIKNNILKHARSIKMAPGWAEKVADIVAEKTDKWIENKEIVTEADLRRQIIKELKILSPDLAFAYQNHDKII